MKILHITNEITKKNFSISSLIIHLKNSFQNIYNLKNSVLAGYLDSNLVDKEKNDINLIKFQYWSDAFLNFKKLYKIISKYEIIHVHGIWAPIQLLSIILANYEKKKLVIHSHGMLLDEAVKGSGIIKYILKKFTLIFLKVIISKSIVFIAITNQEKKIINKYFPNNFIKKIPNPLPFEINSISEENLNKTIVYFGRIHPHKNIHLIIDAFKMSNLSSEWNLEIYGIRDDENYYNFCKKKILNNKNIKIFEPIFGLEKQKKMKSSWLNILISKSEVLSLSILESTNFGLPSLINNKIEFSNDDSEVIKVDEDVRSISNKIIEITNWSEEFRITIGRKFKNILERRSKDSNIIEYTYNLYSDVYKKDKPITHSQNNLFDVFKNIKVFKFFLISSSYIFNLMFASLIVVLLVTTGYFNVAGEIGLVVSLWISITQIFSSNMRTIIISDNNIKKANRALFYRLILSIIMFFVFLCSNEIFDIFENRKLVYSITAFILCQWVNEMKLVQWEIKDRVFLLNSYLFINIFIVATVIFLLYLNYINFLPLVISMLTTYIFISFSADIILHKMNESFSNIVLENISTIAFVSSFSIIISSFIWRLMIFFIFDKSLAGIFFACFSIGSFPGTLINSIVGPTFVKYQIKIPNKVKILFITLFVSIFLLTIIMFSNIMQNSLLTYTQIEFLIFTASLSLLGSFFMSYSMYLRHKIIHSDIKIRKNLFRTDIIYGSSITILIPILYLTYGTFAVAFAFFFASIIAFIFYNTANLKLATKLK